MRCDARSGSDNGQPASDQTSNLNRREWLATTVAGTLLAGTTGQAAPPNRPESKIGSDIAPLRRVLVHEPGSETRKALTLLAQEHPFEAIDLIGPEAGTQHQQFVRLLETSGTRVVRVLDLLNEAITAARAAGELQPWVAEVFPKLVDEADALTGEAVIGADSRLVFPPSRPGEGSSPLVQPLKFLLYTRDLGTMTPSGLVVSNLGMASRDPELALFRFMLTWAPSLTDCPVVFDAALEELQLQGGDVIVADPQTLLVGVGNLTSEQAASRLAERLEMDVIAVSLPGPLIGGRGRRNSNRPLRTTFLHLDTIFSLVDTRTVLAVPYFLESAHSGRDPFSALVKGLVRAGTIDPATGAETLNQVKQIGTIRRYLAGTGELDPLLKEKKLLDYVRARDYKVVPVGGPTEGREPAEHLVENVLHELRFQAANVVAVKPGVVIAAEANRRTNDALKDAGVKVQSFAASELVRWHGGAHCMTLPLSRSEF